jgi:hypothetical protein
MLAWELVHAVDREGHAEWSVTVELDGVASTTSGSTGSGVMLEALNVDISGGDLIALDSTILTKPDQWKVSTTASVTHSGDFGRMATRGSGKGRAGGRGLHLAPPRGVTPPDTELGEAGEPLIAGPLSVIVRAIGDASADGSKGCSKGSREHKQEDGGGEVVGVLPSEANDRIAGSGGVEAEGAASASTATASARGRSRSSR